MKAGHWKSVFTACAGLAALLVAALPAAAHEGHHEELAVLAAVRHLLTQPDHLLAVGGLILLGGLGAGRLILHRRRR